jgi:uncharacterized protein YbjT (DUF2867 family)
MARECQDRSFTQPAGEFVTPEEQDKPQAGPVLVTGATGTLGRPVVDKLLGFGREVLALSRRPQPSSTIGVTWRTADLLSGDGIDEALAGVRSVVHCASSQKGDADATKNLLGAMRRSGVPSLVYISIVGVDLVPLGYYKSKLDAEKLIEASDRRWTILRTTQFHDLLLRGFSALSRSPVMPVPTATSLQPIDVDEVADRLVALTCGEPGAGRVADMGGPEVRSCSDLARSFLSARRRRRVLVQIPLPGSTFAALRKGCLTTPDHAVGIKTFDEFLSGRLHAYGRSDGVASS